VRTTPLTPARWLTQHTDHLLFGNGVDRAGPDLEAFASLQRTAYDAAESVAAALVPGITEKEAVTRLREQLEAHGVRDWFHVPFAWFGDRTAFAGFRLPHQFLPTNRRLEEQMPFILDCAPVLDGACADIGYTGALGTNRALDLVRDALEEHRQLIVTMVREQWELAEIYRSVDTLAARQGLANRHQAYPGRVLAHRVEPLAEGAGRGRLGPFGVRQLRALAGDVVAGLSASTSPLWSDSPRSAHRPTPGLWAVEPHLALGPVGAKFEELLVVTEDDAYWLDEDLPHVRAWRAAA
jgi:Xaa-Pro aminopeptidase